MEGQNKCAGTSQLSFCSICFSLLRTSLFLYVTEQTCSMKSCDSIQVQPQYRQNLRMSTLSNCGAQSRLVSSSLSHSSSPNACVTHLARKVDRALLCCDGDGAKCEFHSDRNYHFTSNQYLSETSTKLELRNIFFKHFKFVPLKF